MSGWGQRMRNAQKDASGIGLVRDSSDREPKCRQNRLFERTQAALVFIQSDIAAPVSGATRGARPGYRAPSRQDGAEDQVISRRAQVTVL
jgi:hypothetical protein